MRHRPLRLNFDAPWAKQDWARALIRDLPRIRAGAMVPRLVALRELEPHAAGAQWDWQVERLKPPTFSDIVRRDLRVMLRDKARRYKNPRRSWRSFWRGRGGLPVRYIEPFDRVGGTDA